MSRVLNAAQWIPRQLGSDCEDVIHLIFAFGLDIPACELGFDRKTRIEVHVGGTQAGRKREGFA
jgi:hypothetical protein